MAGAGYKLFNTGDVLTAAQVNTYLMEQTVMVFADAAARTAALSGVVSEGMISYLKDTNAVEVYNGSAWVASDDPNAIQNTIVDAKGDLITATAADTPSRIAVGNNGETLVADSSASTGLRWNPSIASGKNACINGAFDIWQRGTTFTNPGGGIGTYTADRWTVYFNGNGTVTRETSIKPDTSTYSFKITATASSAGNDAYQLIEEANMQQFRGKDVVVSVKVAGTSGLAPELRLAYSTTANDSLLNTSTNIAPTVIANPAINASTFVTYISRWTVPTSAKTLRVGLVSGTMSNTNVIYWAEVQLELGSAATTFTRAGGTLAGELAACQRYYQKSYDTNIAPQTNTISSGLVLGATQSNIPHQHYFMTNMFKVEMRTIPTVTTYSYTSSTAGVVSDCNGVDKAANTGIAAHIGTRSFNVYNNSGSTVNTANGGFVVHYVASAEL